MSLAAALHASGPRASRLAALGPGPIGNPDSPRAAATDSEWALHMGRVAGPAGPGRAKCVEVARPKSRTMGAAAAWAASEVPSLLAARDLPAGCRGAGARERPDAPRAQPSDGPRQP